MTLNKETNITYCIELKQNFLLNYISDASTEKTLNLDKKQMNKFNVNDFSTSENDSDFLGSGSYASVRRCHHKELGTVIVKYFKLSGPKTAIKKQSENIKNEAKTLCRLHHENIIRMFGVTKWDTYYGVVMEEASGHNLEDLVIHEKDKHISWPLRLQFCVEIAEGLNFLHYHNPKRAYIHGNLKLQNILLSESLVVKIAEFGTVSLLQAVGFSVRLLDFVPLSKQHTRLYSAPEFLKNPEMEQTCAMDVYSFSMICYEIITRNQVFVSTRQTRLALALEMIKLYGYKPNTKLIDNVKQSLIDKSDCEICFQLENIVVKCWQTDPKERPTIKEVKDKLSTTELQLVENKHLIKKHTCSNLKRVSLSDFVSSFPEASNSSRSSTSCDSTTSDNDVSTAPKAIEILKVNFRIFSCLRRLTSRY